MIDNMPRLFYKWVVLQVTGFCQCKTVCPDVRCMAANAFWEVAGAFSLVARWFLAEFSPHSIICYILFFMAFLLISSNLTIQKYIYIHCFPLVPRLYLQIQCHCFLKQESIKKNIIWLQNAFPLVWWFKNILILDKLCMNLLCLYRYFL